MMHALSDDLAHARAAFEAWRAEHGRGRIPEQLWTLALALLDRHSEVFLATHLGLNLGRLRAKAAAQKAALPTAPNEPSARFLELRPAAVPPDPTPEPTPPFHVQIERPDGTRLTLSIPAQQSSTLGAVCTAFLRPRP